MDMLFILAVLASAITGYFVGRSEERCVQKKVEQNAP